MGTRVSFPGGEAAGAWIWPLTIYSRCQKMIEAIPPLHQYALMAWCSIKAQGQFYLYLYLTNSEAFICVSRYVQINNHSCQFNVCGQHYVLYSSTATSIQCSLSIFILLLPFCEVISNYCTDLKKWMLVKDQLKFSSGHGVTWHENDWVFKANPKGRTHKY
jgi:hypothetical protein